MGDGDPRGANGTAAPRRRIGGSVYLAPVPVGAEGNAAAPLGWAPEQVAGQPPVAPERPVATAPPRTRRQRRRWYRRPLFVVPLVLLVVAASVGTALIWRGARTVATLREVSTPPPVVVLSPDGETDPQAAGETAPQAAGETDPQAAVDTAPARAAIAAAGYTTADDRGVFGRVRAAAGDAQDMAEGAAVAAGVADPSAEPMTILLMGVDARPGEAIDVGVRPDALAVLRLDPQTGGCRMLSIPRDSRVDLPGYGLTKINHALAVGGIPYQQLVVEGFLGLRLDRYALIDFGGVETLVDAVGGVTITVPETFTYQDITFEAGKRTLTGAEALTYARYRYGSDGDFGRIRRQQQILRAVLAKGSSLDPLTLVRELLPQLQDHVRTDLNPAELFALGSRFAETCTDETLVTISLDGTVATFDDPLFEVPLSYVVVDEGEVRRKVGDLTAVP